MKFLKNNKASIPKVSIDYLAEEDTDYKSFIPWKNSFEGINFFEWLKTKFSDFAESGSQNDASMVIFTNESTFAFRINTELLNIKPSILWNYWKDEVVDTGYVLKNSEVEKKNKVVTLRYYLKPKLKYKAERDQRFGNITLELQKKEAKAQYVLMKCTWYADHNFKTADHYSSLLSILTN